MHMVGHLGAQELVVAKEQQVHKSTHTDVLLEDREHLELMHTVGQLEDQEQVDNSSTLMEDLLEAMALEEDQDLMFTEDHW